MYRTPQCTYVGTYRPTSSWDISVEYNRSNESSELYDLTMKWKVNELILDLWTSNELREVFQFYNLTYLFVNMCTHSSSSHVNSLAYAVHTVYSYTMYRMSLL